MSAATRAASVAVVVLAIGAAAKAVQGGKKGPDPKKKVTPPVTLPPNPDPGGTEDPFPIRTGDKT